VSENTAKARLERGLGSLMLFSVPRDGNQGLENAIFRPWRTDNRVAFAIIRPWRRTLSI